MKSFVITILSLVLLIGIGVYYWTRDDSNLGEEQVFCTMDAKMCPDGSYVGRVAPNCEFAACPATSDTPSGMMEDGTTSASTSLDVQIGY